MRRVVHVGPLMAPGGMSSVIKLLAANPPEGWRASSCNTYSRRGKLQKLKRWRIARNEIKSGDFDLVHIHCASDWSYKRKLSIAKVANAPVIFHIHSGRFDIDTKSDLDNYHVVCLSKSWSERLKPLIGDSISVPNPVSPVPQEGVERKGKTTAVGLAMDELSEFDGVIVMTDADATMMPGALERINRWFSNPQIGAVGGTPKREGDLEGENQHREMYTMLRVGESAYDSTPFLEGSLIAWRSGLVSSSDLYVKSNADDAQIATAARINGLRSIQDPELSFSDQMPLTAKGQRRQKVRRAQGLIRLLARKRKFWFSKRQGRFAKVLRRNAWMHILSPLAVTGAAALAIMRNIAYLPESALMGALSALEVYCLASWILARSNKSIFGTKTAGVILCGIENLLSALVLAGRGKSLHMWQQHSDVREELSKR